MKRHIITGLSFLALPLAVLAQDGTTPPAAPTTAPRVSPANGEATTRPVISQAEAYALRRENADLKQQIRDLKAQLAGKNIKAQAKPLTDDERGKKIEALRAKMIGMTLDQMYDQWTAIYAGVKWGWTKPSLDAATGDTQYYRFYGTPWYTGYEYLTVQNGKIVAYTSIEGDLKPQIVLPTDTGTNPRPGKRL